jgi:hypothetical protein
MTLMNLQATTLTPSSATSEYVPTGTDEDEARLHEELIRQHQQGVGDVSYVDDFADSGLTRREPS